ncbi:MAG: flavodoxin family protein [Candidatus Woesearchaeota archaeon]
MKAIIICKSVHQNNTEKIAKAMAKKLGARLVKPEDVKPDELMGYDIVGLGSGIYAGRHHASILGLAEKLPCPETEKKAGKAGKKKAGRSGNKSGKMAGMPEIFVFSTAGFPSKLWHRALKKRLEGKGFSISGEFRCRGFDTFGPFRIIGGLNKRHPDRKDIRKAERFAESLG